MTKANQFIENGNKEKRIKLPKEVRFNKQSEDNERRKETVNKHVIKGRRKIKTN